MRLARPGLLTALTLFLAAASLAAEGFGPFTVLDFGPRESITQRIFDDLDGDGRKEILLFSGHRLMVFTPDENGRYDPESPAEIDLAEDALYFAIGDVDGDPSNRELVLVSPVGVSCHVWRNGRLDPAPKLLIPARNLVIAGQPDNVHWRGFVHDVDGDGRHDIILATSRGFALYYQRPRDEAGESGGVWPDRPDGLVPYRLRSSFSTRPGGLGGSITGAVGVPEFSLRDFTGDGRPDFVTDDGLTLRVFAADAQGRIQPEPDREIDLKVLAGPTGEIPPFVIEDLNGDGLPDFVATRRYEGITDIYLSGRPLTDPPLRIKTPGWSFDPKLADLDGDGNVDIIIPTTPEIGVPTAMSVLMTDSITVSNRVHLNSGDPDEPFSKKADLVRDLRVRMRIYLDPTGRIRGDYSVLVDYSADFDGDGRRDLVYLSGSDELLFYPGRETGLFATSPALTVEMPDSTSCDRLIPSVGDFDGDGRPDLAVFLKSTDRKSDRLVLLLTRQE